MARAALIGALAALSGPLAGCAVGTEATGVSDRMVEITPVRLEDGALRYRSSYGLGFEGLHLAAGRPWGVAGMMGMTCQLAFTSGDIAADLDLYPGGEVVLGGGFGAEGEGILVGDGTGVDLIDFPWGITLDAWDTGAVIDAAAVVLPGTDAAAADVAPGLVVRRETADGCEIAWFESGGALAASVALDAASCAKDLAFAVDPDAATVWLGGTAIQEARLAGGAPALRTLDGGATSLAWDTREGLLYGAEGASVRAIRPDGAVAWRVDLGGAVAGLDDAGDWIGAVVSVTDSEGSRVVTLDAPDGRALSDQAINRPAGRVRASEDGSAIAVTHGEGTDFFTRGVGGL